MYLQVCPWRQTVYVEVCPCTLKQVCEGVENLPTFRQMKNRIDLSVVRYVLQ